MSTGQPFAIGDRVRSVYETLRKGTVTCVDTAHGIVTVAWDDHQADPTRRPADTLRKIGGPR